MSKLTWEAKPSGELTARGPSGLTYSVRLCGNGKYNARQYVGSVLLKTWHADTEEIATTQCAKWERIDEVAHQIPTNGKPSERPEG